MCGIVGFISPSKFDALASQLEIANSTLKHRGPNDAGLYHDERFGIGLGHRRLSIIDLSPAGQQPMRSANGEAVIVYNGEIYNFLQLRKQLIARGWRFRSSTDTEVVLNAYLEWGEECLSRFTGMFAFAIWDYRKQELFMARDRMGKKPLYYYLAPNILLFASELKAIMAFKEFPRNVDEEALPLFLHYQYIPEPRSVFQNTYKLSPASYVVFKDFELRKHAYWSLPPALTHEAADQVDESAAILALDHLLTQSVADRLVSDVPIGALLSGGIDSSLVVALMQKVNSTPIRTFSIGFSDEQYNEAPWARKIANHIGTFHTELYVDSHQAIDFIPRLCSIYDEPFADSSAIPTCLVSKLTRESVTVALSGDGGDEQFAGYTRYWMVQQTSKFLSRIPRGLSKTTAHLLQRIPTSLMETFYLAMRDRLPLRFQVANFQDKWQKVLRLLSANRLSENYRRTICIWEAEEILQLIGMPLPKSRFEEIFAQTEHWSTLRRVMSVDQATYLTDCMLTKVDRAGMAAGLEIRAPLLDHRLIEFTSQLPDHFKFRKDTGKYLLKRVLAKYVPEYLFDRPKMGFGVPMAQWLRGPLKSFMLDYLSADRLKKERLYNHALIDRTVDEHLCGRYNHQHRLWALLIWQLWRERWLE